MPLNIDSKTSSTQLEEFIRQADLTAAQEEEALRRCKVHLISSVTDLLLIYKRGELRDLFPPLGLHARMEAQLAIRSTSIPIAKSCLPVVDTMSMNVISTDDEPIPIDSSRGTDHDYSRDSQGERKRKDDEELGRLMKEWFGRNARKFRSFVIEHRCSA